MKYSEQNFRDRLDQMNSYPTTYMFKFIVPNAQIDAIKNMFLGDDIATKDSKGGKYISLTSKKLVQSTEEILQVYKTASKIEGIIAL